MNTKHQAIKIFHLANLHIGARDCYDGVRITHDDWVEFLCQDIHKKSRGKGRSSNYLVVSGDLVNTGLEHEYSKARDIIEKIGFAADIALNRIILVPGNHDLTWTNTRSQCRHNFAAFVHSLAGGEDSRDKSLRIFKEDKLAFLLFDSAAHRESQGGVSSRQLRELTVELQGEDLRGYLLVAVMHHQPHQIDSQGPTLHALRNPSEVFRFLDEWGVELVLHAAGHGSDWWVLETVNGKRIQIGAGSLSPESWRSTIQVQQYNTITIATNRFVRIDTRAFVPGIGWQAAQDRRLLVPLPRVVPERPRMLLLTRLLLDGSNTKREPLIQLLARLSYHDIVALARDLEPSIDSYNPQVESQGMFVGRLVNYFEKQGALAVLDRAVQRMTGSGEHARTRIFLASSKGDDELAEEIAQMLKEMRYEVWFDRWSIEIGDSITERIEEGLKVSDIMIALISAHSVSSSILRMETAMWKALHGLQSFITVRLDDCQIPRELHGVRTLDFGVSRQKWRRDLLANSLAELVPVDERFKAVRSEFAGTQDRISEEEKGFILVSVHAGKNAKTIAKVINEKRTKSGGTPISFDAVDVFAKKVFGLLTSADWDINPVKTIYRDEPTTDTIDFAIVTASDMVRKAVCEVFDLTAKNRVEKGARIYWRGAVMLENGEGYELVVAQAPCAAKNDATQFTNDLLYHWKPGAALLVGIAASAKPHEVRLGDIVIGSEMYFCHEEEPKPDSSLLHVVHYDSFSVDSTLWASANAAPYWDGRVSVVRPDGARSGPKVHTGVIASGEKVIINARVPDEIAAVQRKILAIEMEGYSFALEAWQSLETVRHLAIRAICDDGSEHKKDLWHAYAAAASAGFAKHFLLDRPLSPRRTINRPARRGKWGHPR